MTKPNPFAGLTEHQHCTGQYAVDINGMAVEPTDLTACKWCALGALKYRGVPLTINIAFSCFLLDQYGSHTGKLNEENGWNFAQFESAWDEFVKEREA